MLGDGFITRGSKCPTHLTITHEKHTGDQLYSKMLLLHNVSRNVDLIFIKLVAFENIYILLFDNRVPPVVKKMSKFCHF